MAMANNGPPLDDRALVYLMQQPWNADMDQELPVSVCFVVLSVVRLMIYLCVRYTTSSFFCASYCAFHTSNDKSDAYVCVYNVQGSHRNCDTNKKPLPKW